MKKKNRSKIDSSFDWVVKVIKGLKDIVLFYRLFF